MRHRLRRTLMKIMSIPSQGPPGYVHELNPLAQSNPRVIYDLLFRAMADSWGPSQTIPANARFLFPVRALSKVFRAKFLEGLRRAFDGGELVFSGTARTLAAPEEFGPWLSRLRRKAWVIYSKRPFAGPQQVLEYLGRYTHRVAISNERILGLEHVVVRIHHFGILGDRQQKEELDRCRRLLGQSPSPLGAVTESVRAVMLRVTGIDIEICPLCHRGRMRVTETLPPIRVVAATPKGWNSS